MFPKFKYVSQNNVINRVLSINKSVELGFESEPKISDFNIIKELGNGSYGRVLLVQHNKTKAKYALKIIVKQKLLLNDEDRQQFIREVEIMYKIHHPNVVKLFGHFEDNTYCYLLMEYIQGGELFAYIPQHGKPKISTQQIASIIRDVISAIYFMHHMNPPIMHRDIKPENILITSNLQAKLSDFGWSNYIQPGDKRNSICGTPIYLAPEMINGTGHDERVDIWSIGVLLFELLTGDQAWAGDDVETVKYNISNLKISWPDDMDVLAADLISQILKTDPDERISLSDILNHSFFTQYFSDSTSCLIKPDNKKYKVFVISKDNPLTYNPYISGENQNSLSTSSYGSQTYDQNNYNYNNLFDKYTQNGYNQSSEFNPTSYNYSKQDSIEEEKISWPLEENNVKNGFGKEFSKNGNNSVMWGTPSYNLNNFSSNEINYNYNSFDNQIFLSDFNNGKKAFAQSSKFVIPSNNFDDYLSEFTNGKKAYAQSSKFVIPTNNIQVGTSYDFTAKNVNIANKNKDKRIFHLKVQAKKKKEIERQLNNAFSDNNLNHKFGPTLTFEQNKPKEFDDYLLD